MRVKKKHSRKYRELTIAGPGRQRFRPIHWALLAALALLVCLEIYGPSIRSPLVFDDLSLPFAQQQALNQPLPYWIGGVRPVLMLSYLLNCAISGLNTFSYHFANLLIHTASACLVFAVIFRLLLLAECEPRKRMILSVFSTAVFLVHPLQTESVSYIAGRSESLAALFALAAWCVFLYRRRPEAGWLTSLSVLLLTALAAGTKENMAAFPALFLLTDFYWNRKPFSLRGIRGNWRLYLPMLACLPAAVYAIRRVLAASQTAGLGLKDFTPVSYFLTQTRVVWNYVWLFLFPAGQSIDHEASVSHSVFEQYAWLAIAAWLIVIAAAWAYRQKYRLASFGLFTFLLLLAPTSSFIPIADAFVERRMYLPAVGLLLIACDLLMRIRVEKPEALAAMGCAVIVLGVAAYRRNTLWAQPVSLWMEAVREAPLKERVYSNLAFVVTPTGRCAEARPLVEQASGVLGNNPEFLIAWAKILECVGQRETAMQKLKKAEALEGGSYVYDLEGLLYGEMGKMDRSKAALDKAVELIRGARNPDWAYEDRGYWYEVAHQPVAALSDYRQAVLLNHSNFRARILVSQLERQVEEADRTRPAAP